MVALKQKVAEANFTDTCRTNPRLGGSGSLMLAKCKNNEGEWVDTTIELSQHVGRSQQGRLVWQQGGNFVRYCPRRRIITPNGETRLYATCHPPDSTSNRTSTLNLGERIVNQNGTLIYVEP
ncbi:MAG: CVNH domain-containing protein [Waterburya sp.]